MKEDEDVQAALEPVVLYKIDAEKGEGIGFSKGFKIKGYPTFIMLNSKDQTVDRWIGYSKEYLLRTLEGALMDLSPMTEKQARFEAGPAFNDALALARYNTSLNEYKNAVMYYNTAQKLNTDKGFDFYFEIFANTADGAGDGLFTFEETTAAAEAVLASANSDSEDKYGVARRITAVARKKEKLDLVAPYLEAGIKALENSEEESDIRNHARLMADYSIFVTKDTEKAVAFKKKTMPEGWTEKAGDLNAFAWWCFENGINLEEAEDYSRRSVEIADSGTQKAMCMDTLAEICNALDNCHEAVDLMKKAIAEAPNDDYFKEQLERFEKILASKN